MHIGLNLTKVASSQEEVAATFLPSSAQSQLSWAELALLLINPTNSPAA